MGFATYQYHEDHSISRKSAFRLGGANGALNNHITSLPTDLNAPVAWKLTAEELLAGEGTPGWLVFEAEDAGEGTTLQRVHSVTGLSRSDETEVLLTTEMIEPSGSSPSGGTAVETTGKLFSEALRLTGGTEGGTWKWAAPVMQIGAAHVG